MRRIVVMAMSQAGIACATRIKAACPEDEVNILVTATGADNFENQVSQTNPVAKRQGAVFPDALTLTAKGIALLETQGVALDLADNSVAITTERGALSIRYTDLIIEVQSNSRLPRPLHHKSNVFPLPALGFGQNANEYSAALEQAKKDSLPALVVGSGIAALDAVFIAREAGLEVIWVETPCSTTAGLDQHTIEYIIRQLQPHITQFSINQPAMEVLSFSFQEDAIASVTLPDTSEQKIGVCIWAETFLPIHPLLREDGFILDSYGRICITDERPLGIHVIGSGVATPMAKVSTTIPLPVYAGTSSSAMATAHVVAAKILQTPESASTEPSADTGFSGLYGTATASMNTATARLSVYRGGITEKEAVAMDIPVDHATLSMTFPSTVESACSCNNRLSLTLVGHKEERTIIGVQIVGEGCCAPVAQGLYGMCLEHIVSGVPIDALLVKDYVGTTGELLSQCVERLFHKFNAAIFGITPAEFMASLDAGADFFVLDIRPYDCWAEGHVPQAHNIPIMHLKKRLASEVPRYVPLVIICHDGRDSHSYACTLAGMGAKDLYVLDGGMEMWPYGLEKKE